MNNWQLTQYYQNRFYPHGIQNNWIIHFSLGNFLLHAACLQQHSLTWIGIHTHQCSESSGLMDGEVFLQTISNILCSDCWICWWECSLSSDRNVMSPLGKYTLVKLNWIIFWMSFFHEKITTNMKQQFEFDQIIQKEMIGQQSFSNNFSVNLNDSISIILQVKLLRKSYISLKRSLKRSVTLKIIQTFLVRDTHSFSKNCLIVWEISCWGSCLALLPWIIIGTN